MTEKMALAGVDEGLRGSFNNLFRFKLLKNRASSGQTASHSIKRQTRKKCLTQQTKKSKPRTIKIHRHAKTTST
jgi:hypothetical protein